MGRRTVAAAMAVVMIGAVLAGCEGDSESGASPTVAASSDVRPSATPNPTLTPSPTPSEDALFLEAKEVHLKYLEAMVKMDEVGGVGGLSSEMKALVAGEFQTKLQNTYENLEKTTARAEPNSTWVRLSTKQISPAPGRVVAIDSCVDFRKIVYKNSNGVKVGSGSLRRDVLQFDRRGESLVISEGFSRAVKSCTA